MIRVGRHDEPGAIYIGRGSPLGNPFKMKDKSDEERNRVCDEFGIHLTRDLLIGRETPLNQELLRIMQIAEKEDVVLGCFCSPKRCHGDEIKKYLDLFMTPFYSQAGFDRGKLDG